MIFRIHVDFAGCIPLISWCFAGSFHVATQAFLQVDLFEELGGADVHTSKSGVADHFAENEPEVCPVFDGVAASVQKLVDGEAVESSWILTPRGIGYLQRSLGICRWQWCWTA